ncbi:hypothetical protein BJ170DRAFT_625127 [Xylariales sp. AK1849]|nr:hypothetical protein BJ170DRAFT_625127 [Xylariales sp. AK1849]
MPTILHQLGLTFAAMALDDIPSSTSRTIRHRVLSLKPCKGRRTKAEEFYSPTLKDRSNHLRHSSEVSKKCPSGSDSPFLIHLLSGHETHIKLVRRALFDITELLRSGSEVYVRTLRMP